MPKTIEAVYEDGILKPLEDLELPEHKKVEITISTPDISLNILNHIEKPPKILPIEEIVKAEVIDAD
jgi:predicted DNA-binding antitoxin AbrB/MazE fold protein